MSSARNALNEISRTYSQVHAHKANISLRHYSYECKAAAQERPYISRPSRTQQLFNPKLAPKLTEAKPPALESKQGVADQELAKLEAERAKKRELERDDDEGSERGEISKRRRSASYDSVSTISTGRSRSRSPSPARDLSRSPSPVRRAAPSRSATPDQRRPQRRGYSRDSRSVERSLSPPAWRASEKKAITVVSTLGQISVTSRKERVPVEISTTTNVAYCRSA
ncbi:hypothetical protein PG989_014391 [Apiospora arundinis]